MSRREPEVAVRCVDLSIARPSRGHDQRVVDGVSFVLDHGATLAILGPTGSGKSSLAAVLSGQASDGAAVVGGDAEVVGVSVRRPGRAHRYLTYAVGYLPQSAGATLPARLTVAEVIAEPVTSRDRRVNQRALEIRVAALLDELMLPLGSAAKYPYELSAGMRQRVAVARALMLQPKLFVADEPFANLDVEVRRAVREALQRRAAEFHMASLLVTNDRQAVDELDADVLVLRNGNVVAYGHGTNDLLWTPGQDADRGVIVS